MEIELMDAWGTDNNSKSRENSLMQNNTKTKKRAISEQDNVKPYHMNCTPPKVHLMIEDSVSGLEFWRFISSHLFLNVDVPNLDREVPGGTITNSLLPKIVDRLSSVNPNDVYIALLDQSSDNEQIFKLVTSFELLDAKRNNIIFLKGYRGFEATLLNFMMLLDFVELQDPNAANDFSDLVYFINKCYESERINYSIFSSYVEKFKELRKKYAKSNTIQDIKINTLEQFATAILDILTAKTGFQIRGKARFSRCWTCNCHELRSKDCGLSRDRIKFDDFEYVDKTYRLTSFEKAYLYFAYSNLYKIFDERGLLDDTIIQLRF